MSLKVVVAIFPRNDIFLGHSVHSSYVSGNRGPPVTITKKQTVLEADLMWHGQICLAAAGFWWSLDSAVINLASCNQPPDRYSTNRKYKLFLSSMLGQDGFIITRTNQTTHFIMYYRLQVDNNFMAHYTSNVLGLGVHGN